MPVEKRSDRNGVKIAFCTTNNTKGFSFIFPPLMEREKAHTRRRKNKKNHKGKERERF